MDWYSSVKNKINIQNIQMLHNMLHDEIEIDDENNPYNNRPAETESAIAVFLVEFILKFTKTLCTTFFHFLSYYIFNRQTPTPWTTPKPNSASPSLPSS